MPLILAVEPDPLRLAHVTSLTRGRARTDLLIAESVRAALSAIAARVPDVLLLSPTLSREDRARLADCLDGLGRAAAHVKVLTTPMPLPVNLGRPAPFLPNVPHDQPTASAAKVPPSPEPVESSAQNEWGFFDPGLCGFSALSKLDRSLTDAAQPEPREHVLVRVISY